jgi:hypothetical protein
MSQSFISHDQIRRRKLQFKSDIAWNFKSLTMLIFKQKALTSSSQMQIQKHK